MSVHLPKSWAISCLEEIAEIHDNLREPVNSKERKSRHGPYPYFGATGQVGWIDAYKQDGEYVLLGEDGAPFFDFTKDTAYLVSGKCWVNNHAHVIRGRDGKCLNKYLMYALNQTDYRGYANGTTRLKLTQSAMRRIPINLAPFSEQHRIVAKIEELFSELDKGIESLKTAREQLKVYRQAMLRDAFEGKLTAQWREDNSNKLVSPEKLLEHIQQEREACYQHKLEEWLLEIQAWQERGAKVKKPSKPTLPKKEESISENVIANLPEIPKCWTWIRLANLFQVSPKNGVYKPASTYGNGTPIVRIDDFYDGKITNSNGFKKLRLTPDEVKDYSLAAGDIVLNRVNSIEYLGKCGLVEKLEEATVFESNIMRCRVVENFMSKKFLTFYLSSHQGKTALCKNAKHAVNQASINQTDVGNAMVPICSLDEQREIVDILELVFSQTDNLYKDTDDQLKRLGVLRQSILKKAFSGELVPQDSADQPATKLLKRIKAEIQIHKDAKNK